MLSKKLVTIATEPFTYGYIDDVLLDKELLDYFPPVEVFNKMKGKASGYGHEKWHLNRGKKEFRPNLGPYLNFYRWVASGDGFRQWGREVFDIRSDGGRMEFSALEGNKGYLHPHTDSNVKALSIVIYHSGIPAPLECGATADGPWEPIPWKINRAAWFLKVPESWHRVPVFPGEGWRNTLTLNLVRSKAKHKNRAVNKAGETHWKSKK